MERRLAAILAADVVGYSRLIRADEENTLAALKSLRRDIVDPKVTAHRGRIVKLMGDGMLSEFPSVVDAVRAAVEMQQAIAQYNLDRLKAPPIVFRIGVNLGDVVIEGDDIHGDGVNVAARLEALAKPGGICISGSVHELVRDRIDFAFEDLGEQQVKNIDRPVHIWRWIDGNVTNSPQTQTDPKALPLPDKPSIAVLPFNNMSDEPDQEFFADGMTEDIITELSRFRGLFVIARNTSFAFQADTGDASQIARKLGVRYLLSGSIRKVQKRIRISAQLVDAGNNNHVWAERYDRDLEDIFAVQDEITRTIVSALEPELEEAERVRAISAPPERLDAWGAYHRGLWHIYRFTADDTRHALSLFERAIEIDPSFAPGWSGKSFAHFSNAFLSYVEDFEEQKREAMAAARRSVELDPRDANAHWAIARAHMLHLDYDRAIPEFETAISLNPNFAHGYYQLAWALVRNGNPADALPHIQTADRLSPNDPLRFAFCIVKAQAHYLLRDFELALKAAEEAVRLPHAHAHIEAIRIASLVSTGQLDAATEAATKMLRERPDYSSRLFSQSHGYRRKEDMQLYLDALARAGVPE